MTMLILEHRNRAELADLLADERWIVACLCAAWCDVCEAYLPQFESWAALHPDKHFVWIDIEEHADIVGDLDVHDFPTLLLQRGDIVAFFGAIEPERHQAERILLAQISKNDTELQAEASGDELHLGWQRDCNLRRRLAQTAGS